MTRRVPVHLPRRDRLGANCSYQHLARCNTLARHRRVLAKTMEDKAL